MYLAKLVILTGSLLLTGSLWFLAFLLYLAAEIAVTIRREEPELMKSAAYGEYARNRARLFPGIL